MKYPKSIEEINQKEKTYIQNKCRAQKNETNKYKPIKEEKIQANLQRMWQNIMIIGSQKKQNVAQELEEDEHPHKDQSN